MLIKLRASFIKTEQHLVSKALVSQPVLSTRVGFPTGTNRQSRRLLSKEDACSCSSASQVVWPRDFWERASQDCEAIGHHWWALVSHAGGEGVAGRRCGKTCYKDRWDSSDRWPWVQGCFRRKQLQEPSWQAW